MTEPTTPLTDYEPPAEPTPRPPMTHPVNVVHLVFGLIFLGVTASWALQASDVVNPDANWFLPVVLIAAGLGGLVPVVVNAFRAPSVEQQP